MRIIARLTLFGIIILGFTGQSQEPQPVGESEPDAGQWETRLGQIKLAGWLDLLYQDDSENRHSFKLNHFYLYTDIIINQKWRGFAEVEFENEPNNIGEEPERDIFLERAYIEYKRNNAFIWRVGKFITPAGIWKPQHWAVTVDTIQKPIMEDNLYIPTKSVGLQFLGNKVSKVGDLNYSAIFTSGGEASSSDFRLNKARGLGTDFNYAYGDRFMLGFSYYRYEQLANKEEDTDAKLGYAEFFIVKNKLLLRTEVLAVKRDFIPDIRTFYAKIKWQITPRFYLNYRYDFGDDERRAEGRDHGVNSFTVGYWPHQKVRFKAEYLRHSFQQREGLHQWSLWMGLVY